MSLKDEAGYVTRDGNVSRGTIGAWCGVAILAVLIALFGMMLHTMLQQERHTFKDTQVAAAKAPVVVASVPRPAVTALAAKPVGAVLPSIQFYQEPSCHKFGPGYYIYFTQVVAGSTRDVFGCLQLDPRTLRVTPGIMPTDPWILTAVPPFITYWEPVQGVTDGVNTIFTVSGTPNPPGSSLVMMNGVLQAYITNYTVSGMTITFTVAPPAGALLRATYTY